jgi:hypothetical protein
MAQRRIGAPGSSIVQSVIDSPPRRLECWRKLASLQRGAGRGRRWRTGRRSGGSLGPDWAGARLALAGDEPGEGGLRRLTFRNHEGEAVPALYLPSRTGAAVLYCHAHGGRYDIGMARS